MNIQSVNYIIALYINTKPLYQTILLNDVATLWYDHDKEQHNNIIVIAADSAKCLKAFLDNRGKMGGF